MWRFFFRVIGAIVLIAGIGIAGVAAAYYSGVTLPVSRDVTQIAFSNWTRTRAVEAELGYDAEITRRGDRIWIRTELNLPEAVDRLQAYLDGGRTLVVTCGPQSLFMHSLRGASLVINDPVVSLSGNADLELAGLLDARDDWPVAASVRLGHSRTEIWADLIQLEIAGLPDPMSAAIIRDHARVSYTREQILDMASDGLSPDLAEALARHRGVLDLAFEAVTPRLEAGILTADATFSIDEDAAFGLLATQIAADSGLAFAEILGPARAEAQILDQLRDIGREVEGAARQIEREITDNLDPEKVLDELAGSLDECTAAF